uniref:Si:ch211-159i8.4 n=1 Tax=Latimeria chalumnae TaxID=7897 RepID=H3ACF0_LATCH
PPVHTHALAMVLMLILLCGSTLPSHSCPQPCSCPRSAEIHCTFRHLASVPTHIPKTTQRINFGFNNIQTVGSQGFAGLERLELLMLHGNKIPSLSEGTFQQLRSLQVLKLSYNKLRVVSWNTFGGLSALHRLHLDHNQIELIYPGAFIGLTALRLLQLEGNRLHHLHPDTFVTFSFFKHFHISTIRHLYLSDNQLASLSPRLFLHMNSLETLHLHGNPWRCDCGLQWLVDWNSQTESIKCKKDPALEGGQLCPKCFSPRQFKGTEAFQIPAPRFSCTKPTILSPEKLENSSIWDESEPELSSVEDFQPPLGNLALNLTDNQHNMASLACVVKKPGTNTSINWERLSEQEMVINMTFSSYVECSIDKEALQRLWRMIAYYYETPAKLQRGTMVKGDPILSYEYRQVPDENAYYYTELTAKVAANPRWLMQPQLSFQLERRKTTTNKLVLIYRTELSQTFGNVERFEPMWVMIQEEAHLQTAVEGTDVQFDCKIIGSVSPVVKWIFPDLTQVEAPYMDNDHRVRILANGTLLIRAVDTTDSGIYQCVAKAEDDVDVMPYRLSVKEVLLSPEALNGREVSLFSGGVLNLSCLAVSVPNAQITWFLPNNTILHLSTHSERYIANDSTLIVREISAKDSGYYVCTAMNLYGVDILAHNVLIQDKFNSELSKPRKVIKLFSSMHFDTTDQRMEEEQEISGDGEPVTSTEQFRPSKKNLARKQPAFDSNTAEDQNLKEGSKHRMHLTDQSRSKMRVQSQGKHRTLEDKREWETQKRTNPSIKELDPQRWADILAQAHGKSITDTEKDMIHHTTLKSEDKVKTSIPGNRSEDSTTQGLSPEETGARRAKERQTLNHKTTYKVLHRPTYSTSHDSATLTSPSPPQSFTSEVSKYHNVFATRKQASKSVLVTTLPLNMKMTQRPLLQEQEKESPQTVRVDTLQSSTPGISSKLKNMQLDKLRNQTQLPSEKGHLGTSLLDNDNTSSFFKGHEHKGSEESLQVLETFTGLLQPKPTTISLITKYVADTTTNSKGILEPVSRNQDATAPHTSTTSPFGKWKHVKSTVRPTANKIKQTVSPTTHAFSRTTLFTTRVTRTTQSTVVKVPHTRFGKGRRRPRPKKPLFNERKNLVFSPGRTEKAISKQAVTTTALTKLETSTLSPWAPEMLDKQHSHPLLVTAIQTVAGTTYRQARMPDVPSTETISLGKKNSMSRTATPTPSSAMKPFPTAKLINTFITMETSIKDHHIMDGSLSTSAINAQSQSPHFANETNSDKSKEAPELSKTQNQLGNPLLKSDGTLSFSAAATSVVLETSTKTATFRTTVNHVDGYKQVPILTSGKFRTAAGSPELRNGYSGPTPVPFSTRRAIMPCIVVSPVMPFSATLSSQKLQGQWSPLNLKPSSTVTENINIQTQKATSHSPLLPIRLPEKVTLHAGPMNPFPTVAALPERGAPRHPVALGNSQSKISYESFTHRPVTPGVINRQVDGWNSITTKTENHSYGGSFINSYWFPVFNSQVNKLHPGKYHSFTTTGPKPATDRALFRLPIPNFQRYPLQPNWVWPYYLSSRRNQLVTNRPEITALTAKPTEVTELKLSTLPPRTSSQLPIKHRAQPFIVQNAAHFNKEKTNGDMTNSNQGSTPPRLGTINQSSVLQNGVMQYHTVQAGRATSQVKTAYPFVNPKPPLNLPLPFTLKPTITTTTARSLMMTQFDSTTLQSSSRRFSIHATQGFANTVLSLPILPRTGKRPRIMTGDSESVSLLAEADVFLDCNASGDPAPLVSWTKISTGATIPANSKHGQRFEVHQNGTFVIRNVRLQDRGQYLCMAQNPHGSDRRVVTLIVLSLPPKIQPPKFQHVTSYVGKLVLLPCSAEGRPLPQIAWLLPDKTFLRPVGLRDRRAVLLPNGTLKIPKATFLDNGNYKCIASNAAGADTTVVHLHVAALPPMIEEQKMETLVLSMGQSVYVHCTARGEPEPTLKWTLPNGTQIKASQFLNRKFFVYPNGTLLIRSGSLEDGGSYECSVTNLVGTSKRTVNIGVKKEPVGPDWSRRLPQGITVTYGATLYLHCDVAERLPGSTLWRLPSKKVVNSNYSPERYVSALSNGTLVVRSIADTDAGDYLCIARTDNGQDVKVFQVQVMMKPATIEHKEQTSHSVLQGGNIKVDCVASGFPNPEITWSLPDGRMVSNALQSDDQGGNRMRRYTIFGNGTLFLDQIGKMDEGDYTCYAENKVGKDQLKINVKVMSEPPQIFLKDDSLMQVRLGDPAILNCEAAGEPTPKITWLSPANKVITSFTEKYQVHSNGSLTFKSVAPSDSGMYTCVAHNGVGNDIKYIKLQLLAWGPQINGKGGSFAVRDSAVVYQKKLFDCKAGGFPAPRVTWVMPYGAIFPAPYVGSRIEVYKNGTLELRGLRQSDSGQLVCRAQNKVGESRMTVQLEVVSVPQKPSFDALQKESLILTSQTTMSFSCSASGTPPPDLTWILPNGTQLKPGTKLSRIYHAKNGTLLLFYSAAADAGTYRCIAKNVAGQAEKFILLENGRQPEFRNRSPGLERILHGETLRLHCIVDGLPQPHLTWILPNGFVLDRPQTNGRVSLLANGTLFIREVVTHDRGTYTCKAVNEMGSVELSFPVIVIVYPPHITSATPASVRISAGHAIYLKCQAIGIPKAEVFWDLPDNTRLLPSQRFHMSGGKHMTPEGTLVLQTPVPADSGVYKCNAKNVLGMDSKPTYLQVL